ncbi:28128_t:CDS:1, partial [Gigaspora margarita]
CYRYGRGIELDEKKAFRMVPEIRGKQKYSWINIFRTVENSYINNYSEKTLEK